MDSGFRAGDSGFLVSGTWIPDSNRFIPTYRIPDSTKQNSRIPDTTSTNFPDYGMGQSIVTDHLRLATSPPLGERSVPCLAAPYEIRRRTFLKVY